MAQEINVLSRTQIIKVDPVSGSIAIINAGSPGPPGPAGSPGPPGAGDDGFWFYDGSSLHPFPDSTDPLEDFYVTTEEDGRFASLFLSPETNISQATLESLTTNAYGNIFTTALFDDDGRAVLLAEHQNTASIRAIVDVDADINTASISFGADNFEETTKVFSNMEANDDDAYFYVVTDNGEFSSSIEIDSSGFGYFDVHAVDDPNFQGVIQFGSMTYDSSPFSDRANVFIYANENSDGTGYGRNSSISVDTGSGYESSPPPAETRIEAGDNRGGQLSTVIAYANDYDNSASVEIEAHLSDSESYMFVDGVGGFGFYGNDGTTNAQIFFSGGELAILVGDNIIGNDSAQLWMTTDDNDHRLAYWRALWYEPDPDALVNGDCAFWFDPTNGSASWNFFGKQSDGTVVTAVIPMS